MNMHIILFGQLADIAGKSVFMQNVADTDSLINTLHNTYPALSGVKYAVAVNKQVITSNTFLDENSVVALLPPFSGG